MRRRNVQRGGIGGNEREDMLFFHAKPLHDHCPG
jgi:hypothetical protein